MSTATGSLVTTGGGFSNYLARPSFQDAEVLSYLSLNASLVPPSSMFNSSNRAYPDMSVIARNVPIIWNGQNRRTDGMYKCIHSHLLRLYTIVIT